MFPCPNCFSLKPDPKCLVCRDTIVSLPTTPNPKPPKIPKDTKKQEAPPIPEPSKKPEDKKDDAT